MIQRITKFVQECDFFGCIFLLRITKTDSIFKTFTGGLLSISIFVISAAYFTYLMLAWNQGQLPPTVTTQINDISDQGILFNLSQSVFVFGFDIENPTQKSRQAQIHKQLYYQNSTYLSGGLAFQLINNNECNVPTTQWDFFASICQNVDYGNQTSMYADPLRELDTYFVYQIFYCNESNDAKCISESLKEDIVKNQDPYWRLTLIKQDFDYTTKIMNNIPTDYYFKFNPDFNNTSLFIQIKVQKGLLLLDEGYIFSSYREIEFVNGLSLLVSEYTVQPLQGPHIEVSLEKYTTVIRVQYPKLGQVLAILGSLFQGLLIGGYILGVINKNLMYGKIKELLLQMYFPDFAQIKFLKDWKQNVIGVQGKTALLSQQDQNIILKLRQDLLIGIEEKFNYVHLLREINKLQISLMMIFPRKHIRMIQNLNYNIIKPNIGLEPQLNILEGKNIQSSLPINQEDFLVVSSAKWKEYDTSWEAQDEDLEENGDFLIKAFYDKILLKILQNNTVPSLGCESSPLPKCSASVSQSNILAQKIPAFCSK